MIRRNNNANSLFVLNGLVLFRPVSAEPDYPSFPDR
jgi:hypothetical protein